MSVVNKKERKPTNLELFFLDKQELEEKMQIYLVYYLIHKQNPVFLL